MSDKQKRTDHYAIDAVITWVDGNDPAWRKQREQYAGQKCGQEKKQNTGTSDMQGLTGGVEADETSQYTSDARYRSWDNLQYWFRGIEQHCPWFRKIHFVTWGHLPKWLNTKNPKLHIVRHEDFIPSEYLPTFNTNAIELNLHRIPGLAEHFVYFNDDTFIIRDMKRTDFFYHGMPRDAAILSPYVIRPNGIAALEANNLEIINKYFSTADVLHNKKKWINPIYGKKVLRTLLFSRYSYLVGVLEPHIPLAFRKRTFETVWQKEEERLDETSRNRFRSRADVTDWLMRQWQLFSGDFIPRKWDIGKLCTMPKEVEEARHLILHPDRYSMLCINDSTDATNFEALKQEINQAFEERYPKKSQFEL